MIVRCNSCARTNDLIMDVADTDGVYEQYDKPHVDLLRPFSCCWCDRKHYEGTSVELVEDE